MLKNYGNILKVNPINLRDLFTKDYSDLLKLYSWIDYDECIYKITNIINQKSYIGQAINFYSRLVTGGKFSHLTGYINNCKGYSNIRLYNALEKYGSKNFIIELIAEPLEYSHILGNRNQLNWLETYFIKLYHTCKYDQECWDII